MDFALSNEVEEYRRGHATEDPLAGVDDPMGIEEGVEATVWAELEAGENRSRLLRQSINAGEAGRLSRRSGGGRPAPPCRPPPRSRPRDG